MPTLLQLAARSICISNRCISPRLVRTERFCQSPMESDRQSPSENPIPRSLTGSDSASMENTILVSNTAENADRPSVSTPSTGNHPEPSVSRTSASRLEHLRERFRSQNLSDQATELVLKSWRSKTSKSYDSLFGKWHRWCDRRGSDPFLGPISEVANFLVTLFGEGYQYNSVNAYRSAISSVHEKVDNMDVGQHPTVVRLMKGVYNDRPPLPRYSSTWNVQTVLNFIETLGDLENLLLKHLTWKTVFLLAVTRPSRSADLSQLDTSRMRFSTKGAIFLPSSLAKQSRQGKTIAEFFFPSFPDNSNLCPVQTLKVYMERTGSLREGERRLFIALIKPHKAVVSSSIARWLRDILNAAGVDTTIFTAHSTHGASASSASKSGITTNDILKAANWSSESVFQRFYHKEVERAAYGRAVLGGRSRNIQNSSE